ncbi:MAG: hypothetical protein QM784_34855 [Polyangiaceae bacterium]
MNDFHLGVSSVLLLVAACAGPRFEVSEQSAGSAGQNSVGGASTEGGKGGAAGETTGSGTIPSATCSYLGTTYALDDTFTTTSPACTCSCKRNGVTCDGDGCSNRCTQGGKSYVVGEIFPASDDCNTCSCTPSGTVVCTKLPCESGCSYVGTLRALGTTFPAADGCNTCTCGATLSCTSWPCSGECTYAGSVFIDHATFPATDGCNECSCNGGKVTCTSNPCTCDPAKEPWRNYVLDSRANCEVARMICPTGSTYFANDCGCGCEQKSSCPSIYDCTVSASSPVEEGTSVSEVEPCPPADVQENCPFTEVLR